MRTMFILSLLVAVPSLGAAVDAMPFCPPQPVHSYAGSGAVVLGNVKVGGVTVHDTNLTDCDNDGDFPDRDGDYETGFGGGFFGWGLWAAACQVNVYGPDVAVFDAVWATAPFEIGANDMTGPITIFPDPSGDPVCVTDGIIAPPVDFDDCLTTPYVGIGQTCGGGGDGGYWVIIDLPPPGTVGTIVSGFFGAPLNPPAAGVVGVTKLPS